MPCSFSSAHDNDSVIVETTRCFSAVIGISFFIVWFLQKYTFSLSGSPIYACLLQVCTAYAATNFRQPRFILFTSNGYIIVLMSIARQNCLHFLNDRSVFN